MNKSDYNILFGEFLNYKREYKGLTQTDLASLIGNNSQNISRLEKGEITPTIFWLEKLAGSFECKTSELIAEFEVHREKELSETKGGSIGAYQHKKMKDGTDGSLQRNKMQDGSDGTSRHSNMKDGSDSAFQPNEMKDVNSGMFQRKKK